MAAQQFRLVLEGLDTWSACPSHNRFDPLLKSADRRLLPTWSSTRGA